VLSATLPHRLSQSAETRVALWNEIERELPALHQISASIARAGQLSDRARSRVMAAGELMATHIGVRFLRSRGLEVAWADARTMLRAEERHSASAKASVLSAVCGFAPDAALEERLRGLAAVIVTQGFIASDEDGNTVL